MPHGRIGWGIIGTGAIVRDHMLAALAADERSDVVGIVSHDPKRAAALAAECGLVSWPDLDAMLADSRVDAVYVATTHDRHANETRRAIDAGRRVLCEKPLALRMEDATAVVEAADSAGMTLAVNHPLRGLPSLCAMRDAVAAGAIGKPRLARFMYAIQPDLTVGDWHRIGPAAGVLLDISIHTVDCARFILASEIAAVHALGQGAPGWDADHSVMLQLQMTDGVLVSTCDSLIADGTRNGIEIHGSGGAIIGDGVVGGLDLRSEWELRSPGGRELRDAGAPVGGLFAPTIAAFTQAILGSGQPLATGEDHLLTLEVVLAAGNALRA